MKTIAIAAIAAFLALSATACKGDKKAKKGSITYVAQMESPEHGVTGTVTLTQAPGDPLVVKANLHGLAKGGHAVHIHANGDCSNGFKKVGPHFMGGMKMKPGMKHKPMGDLGNFEADDKGASKTKLSSGKLSLFGGPTSVAGRAIVVHAGPDGVPGKSAGAKVACGVIKK